MRIIVIVEMLQTYLPQNIKQALKKYFRVIFPNKLMAVWYMTFRCSYQCSYCPYCSKESNFPKQFPIACEKSGEEWIKALENIPPTAFYICGGEPFVYKDLPYIINNLPKKHSIIGIVSNLSMPIDLYKQIKKKIHFNISFHREFAEEDTFIKNVLELKKMFDVTVNIVATEDNFDFIKNKIQVFKQNNIQVHIDPLVEKTSKPHLYSEEYAEILKSYNKSNQDRGLNSDRLVLGVKRKCSAGRNYYNLLPNGNAVYCARAMEQIYSPFIENDKSKTTELGNVFDGTFKLNKKDFICKYDCLTHCDWDYTSAKIINN